MKTFGLDMSHYQGIPDFEAIKADTGAEFVILKCGGSEDGFFKEYTFEEQYKKAKAAGLKVGAYYLLDVTSPTEALVAADYAEYYLKDKQFEYPIFADIESPRMRDLGKDKLSSIVKSFCNAMENKGFWCGFYTNLDWYYNYLNGPELAARYSFWFAFWSDRMADIKDVQMWQNGLITYNGLDIDSDYCFVDYPALIKARGKNGYKATGSTTPSTPEKPKEQPLRVGDGIMLSKDATIYGTTNRFYNYVYNTQYTVIEINGNRVVFGINGAITGAVDKKYVIKI